LVAVTDDASTVRVIVGDETFMIDDGGGGLN
jgi:hypothetical protein